MGDITKYPGVGSCESWCSHKFEVARSDSMSQTVDLEGAYTAEIEKDCMQVTGCDAARFTETGRAAIQRAQRKPINDAIRAALKTGVENA